MTARRWVLLAAVLAFTASTPEVASASTSRSAGAAQVRVRWLAMGDSYSSGEGIPGTNPGNPARQGQENCARANGDGTNAKAWAVVAAKALAAQRPDLAVEDPFFVACTGAVADSAATQLAEMRSMVTDPPLQKWNLVSFSFGGNSIGFADILKGCIDLNSVWGAFDLSAGCDISAGEIRNRVDMLVGKVAIDPSAYTGSVALPAMLDDVASAVATGGHVLVVGYPNLVEETSRWDPWRRRFLDNCEGIKVWDVAMLRSATEYLNDQIRFAVQAADARWMTTGIRFHFVDIATAVYEKSGSAGDRHALCSQTPWLNGLTLGITSGDLRKERSYHPKQEGHTATGTYLASALADGSLFRFVDPPAPTPEIPTAQGIADEFVQLYLNMLSYGPLAEDGQLGPASQLAIQQFQSDNGLDPTGLPDARTIDLLIEQAGKQTFAIDGCGYEMDPRPTQMYLNCSLSMGLVDVVWDSWTAQGGRGTGRVFVRDCDAGCISGEP